MPHSIPPSPAHPLPYSPQFLYLSSPLDPLSFYFLSKNSRSVREQPQHKAIQYEEESQEQAKRARNTPSPTVRSPPNHQADRQNIPEEDLVQTHAGLILAPLVSVGPFEPCLVDSAGQRSADVLHTPTPTVFPPPSIGFPEC